MDAGEAFVARSIEAHLGARPEHVATVASSYGDAVFEAVIRRRTVLFKADREPDGDRVVLEAWAYQRARELGAPVPRVLAVDLGRESYPRNFIIIEKVLGVPLATLDLKAEGGPQLLRKAGWAIRAVHEIGVPGFGLLQEAAYLRSAQVQGAFESWGDFLAEILNVTVPALRDGGAMGYDEAARIGKVVADHEDHYDLGPVGHLLHGRFDPAHVLIHEGEITALVDFSDRCSGDPAWDLSGFLLNHAPETRHLLAGYDADKELAPAFELTIPLYGALRALLGAREAHDEGRTGERDRCLVSADSAFRALGYPGSHAY